MTCIAAYIGEDGETAIAADSLCSSGSHQFEVAGGKLVDLGRGGWVAGCAGASLWMRFGRDFAEHMQSLDEDGKPVELDADELPEAFADAWVSWAAERNHGSADDGHWGLLGHWILARHGEIRIVCCDGSVLEPAEGYAALGSGAAVALGALWQESDLEERGFFPHLDAESVARAAVRAACVHADGVGGVIRAIVCTEPDGLPPEPGEE